MSKTTTFWVAIATAMGCVTVGAIAQQALSGAQTLMIVPASRLAGKVHVLPATLETTQWGWFDNAELPRLTIDSGDTVVFETMSHAHGQLFPGRTIDELKKLRTDWPGRGPMTITGPVFVNGAEPGDVLQIKINKIVARPWGANFNVPGMFGQFPKEFPDGQVKYFYLDWERKVAEFAPGIEIPLRPFPGTLGVARAQPGRYNAVPPGPFAGNLDNRELVEGTTLHVPVFVRGALAWTGDSHAAQGNGEVNLTAIETAFGEMNVTITVDKTRRLEWPRIEAGSDWITMGFDEDLGKALDGAKSETAKLLAEQRKIPAEQAAGLVPALADCRVTQLSTSSGACTASSRKTSRAHGRFPRARRPRPPTIS
jgi:acetamidase/formamidase